MHEEPRRAAQSGADRYDARLAQQSGHGRLDLAQSLNRPAVRRALLVRAAAAHISVERCNIVSVTLRHSGRCTSCVPVMLPPRTKPGKNRTEEEKN